MRENKYQRHIISRLRKTFPGCFIIKNDPNYLQGIPDLTILYKDRWGLLEVKASRTAAIQPNQTYYIQQLDEMSFAAFIYPEVEEEVFDGLARALDGD